MSKFYKILFMVFLGFTSSALAHNTRGHQAMPNTNKAIMVSNDKTQFELKLPANPTTGYAWYIKRYDPTYIKPVSEKFTPANKKKVGAPGTDVWTFQALPSAFNVPHMMKIKMVYAQAWNLKDAQKETFVVVTR